MYVCILDSKSIINLHLENIPECVFGIDEGLEMLFPLESVSTVREDASSDLDDVSVRSASAAAMAREAMKKDGFYPVRKIYTPPPPDYVSKAINLTSVPNGSLSAASVSTSPFKTEPPKLVGLFGNLNSTTGDLSSESVRSLNPSAHPEQYSGHGRRLASTAPLHSKQLSFLATNQYASDDHLLMTEAPPDHESNNDNGKSNRSDLKKGIAKHSLLESTRSVFLRT